MIDDHLLCPAVPFDRDHSLSASDLSRCRCPPSQDVTYTTSIISLSFKLLALADRALVCSTTITFVTTGAELLPGTSTPSLVCKAKFKLHSYHDAARPLD